MKSILSSLIWFLRTCLYNTPIKNWKLTAWIYARVGRRLIGSDPFPVIDYGGFKLKTNGADVIVTAALINGNYEPFTLQVFQALVKEGLQKSPGAPFVFADIGANIGIFSVTAAFHHPGLQVFAFEPNPVSSRLLEENLALNGLHQVTVVKSAVGEAPGTASLDISSPHAGVHSITSDGANRLEVPVLALDDFFAAAKVTPRLFKADVEGYEPLVLRGMKTLLQTQPLQLILEFNPEHLQRGGKDPATFLDELTGQFDAIFCLDEIERAPLPYLPQDQALRHKIVSVGYNLLLLRGEAPECLKQPFHRAVQVLVGKRSRRSFSFSTESVGFRGWSQSPPRG